MDIDTARQKCKNAGVTFRACSEYHWQIRDGKHYDVVNVWTSKDGMKYGTGTNKAIFGSFDDALELAGSRPHKKTPPFKSDEGDDALRNALYSIIGIMSLPDSYGRDQQVIDIAKKAVTSH